MKDHPEVPVADPRRAGSRVPVDDGYTERDEWLHDFRNALGTILVAANVANFALPGQPNVEFSTAMERIEDGCNRCLRLLRTMPAD